MILGGHLVVVGVGIVVWGLGASLGFPVGMSAAADDPARSAARVSVVSTIGYGAFLAGPPLLGWLGDRVGTLEALSAVTLLMIPAAVTVFAARHLRGSGRISGELGQSASELGPLVTHERQRLGDAEQLAGQAPTAKPTVPGR